MTISNRSALALALSIFLPAISHGGDLPGAMTKFAGPDLSIQGTETTTPFGRVTFREGIIELKGKKFKIFTSSMYGNIGALGVDNTDSHKEVLFFTSSFQESVTQDKLPNLASQTFDACLNSPYNALAVVYDITGVIVKDEQGAPLNLSDATVLKKQLVPNLNRTLENSKSSAAYCRLIEKL